MIQGLDTPSKDLIGALGLPGAVLALALAFLLGIRAWQTLKRNGNGHGDTALNAEKRTQAAVERILERLDKHHEILMKNINDTRHDIRNMIHQYMFRSPGDQ